MVLTETAASAAEAAEALVIGGGPAGLMAAEMLARAGVRTVLAEAMPTVGRKLLMAGKSGLNLTKMEPADRFIAQFGKATPRLAPIVGAFPPDEVRRWAEGLGQSTFTGSTGRLFPRAMKASPLLRAWLARLAALGVDIHTSWRWTGQLDPARFSTPGGERAIRSRVVVLALGGASWRRLGSDGAWAPVLRGWGTEVATFRPANAAIDIAWSPHMTRHFGAPLKAVRLTAGSIESRGEAIISQRGLEGGGVYGLTPALREAAPLSMDLAPDLGAAEIAERLSRPRGKATRAAHLRRVMRFDPIRLAMLHEFGRPLPDGAALARLLKSLPVPYAGLRPLDEAISTAGGVGWGALDDTLMLTSRPSTFVAGEMIDWEAPTGGYLLTACMATGRWAGTHAARLISDAPSSQAGSTSAP